MYGGAHVELTSTPHDVPDTDGSRAPAPYHPLRNWMPPSSSEVVRPSPSSCPISVVPPEMARDSGLQKG
jgi:hypothetical protein